MFLFRLGGFVGKCQSKWCEKHVWWEHFAILRGKCGKLAGLSWPFRTIASGLCYSKGVVEKLANHWTGARNNWQEYWWNNMQTLWTPHLPIIRRTPLQKNIPILIMKHNVIEFELLRTLVMNQCAPICGTDSWRSRERNYTYEYELVQLFWGGRGGRGDFLAWVALSNAATWKQSSMKNVWKTGDGSVRIGVREYEVLGCISTFRIACSIMCDPCRIWNVAHNIK